MELRKRYCIDEGDPLTLIDLEELIEGVAKERGR
jgi:hypothetical protein